MTENDDKLIERFLLDNKQELEDNGFSRRVMKQLPSRALWWSDVLSAVCTVLCCLLFYAYDGFGILFQMVAELIACQSFQLAFSGISLPSLVIAALAFCFVGIQRAYSLKW